MQNRHQQARQSFPSNGMEYEPLPPIFVWLYNVRSIHNLHHDTIENMDKLPLYCINAFTDKAFEGNPAAVCPLPEWPDDRLLQQIAAQNNLSETAYFVAKDNAFEIRWFSPLAEVDLCGHATLASAYVLFHYLGYAAESILFHSLSGPLSVKREGRLLELDFPLQIPQSSDMPPLLAKALSIRPHACLRALDHIAVFDNEDQIRTLQADMSLLKQLGLRGVAVTAPAREPDKDFVVRFFAPKYGIDEDPVTGSAYTQLAPYWAQRLGKSVLQAVQLSMRGGKIRCRVTEKRILIAGSAHPYLIGSIQVT